MLTLVCSIVLAFCNEVQAERPPGLVQTSIDVAELSPELDYAGVGTLVDQYKDTRVFKKVPDNLTDTGKDLKSKADQYKANLTSLLKNWNMQKIGVGLRTNVQNGSSGIIDAIKPVIAEGGPDTAVMPTITPVKLNGGGKEIGVDDDGKPVTVDDMDAATEKDFGTAKPLDCMEKGRSDEYVLYQYDKRHKCRMDSYLAYKVLDLVVPDYCCEMFLRGDFERTSVSRGEKIVSQNLGAGTFKVEVKEMALPKLSDGVTPDHVSIKLEPDGLPETTIVSTGAIDPSQRIKTFNVTEKEFKVPAVPAAQKDNGCIKSRYRMGLKTPEERKARLNELMECFNRPAMTISVKLNDQIAYKVRPKDKIALDPKLPKIDSDIEDVIVPFRRAPAPGKPWTFDMPFNAPDGTKSGWLRFVLTWTPD